MKAIWKFLIKLFSTPAATPAPVKEPSAPVTGTPSTPIPIKGMLSREEYVKLDIAIFKADVKVAPYNDHKYETLRESSGSNRSKGIDALIKRQGGSLGDAYCQFGQQDKMDALAVHLNIPRKLWNYPEGGGTQRVFEKTDAKYKRETPLAGCFWTVQYNHGGKGHIEDVVEVISSTKVKTAAFNTTIDGDDTIVRDGQGGGFAIRPLFKEKRQGDDVVTTRGFVDHYLIYVDAFKKLHNVA